MIRESASVSAAVAVGILCASAAVLAHHSRPVQYDTSRLVEIKGTVLAIEWQNPHTGFTLSAEQPDGCVTVWDSSSRERETCCGGGG